MRISELVRIIAFGGNRFPRLPPAAPAGALAFDEKVFDEGGSVKAELNPWAVFQFGFSAYKGARGIRPPRPTVMRPRTARSALTWKLARMYAMGDGVARNDYEAFKFFSEIAEQDVEPGSREESYVSDALVALGGYMKTGIPGSPIEADFIAAQEYYMRAAANYRNPNAQFEMGNMFLKGEGGVQVSRLLRQKAGSSLRPQRAMPARRRRWAICCSRAARWCAASP